MKNIKIILMIVWISLILLFNCSQNKVNIIEPPVDTPQDTLIWQITDGVFTELKQLEDSYSLDEDIEFQIIIYNQSDTNSFQIYYGYLQAYTWRIFNNENKSVAGGPNIISPAGFERSLEIGDSVIFNLWWSQNIYNETKIISDLQAFSGNYYLVAQPFGNSLFKQMTKFFEITNIGESLSVNVDKDYEIEDTLKFKFIIRNRTSQQLNYNLSSHTPITVSFVQFEDTALVQYFPLQSNQLQLNAHSDSLLFEYKAANQDSAFNHLSGVYKVSTSISIQNKVFSSSCREFF